MSMSFSPRRKLAIGASGLVAFAGAGGAYAAAQSNSPARPDPAAEQKAFLDDLAGRLHVSRDDLDSAIKGAATDRIDAAVAAGRLTKAQADELKQRIQKSSGLPLLGLGHGPGGAGGPGPRGRFGPGPGGPGFGFGLGTDGAAKYLGMTERQLFDALRGGKSLAQVAKDKGKSVDGLKAAIKSAETARLDQAVKAGRLTDAERTRTLSGLDQRLDDLVNRTPPKAPRLFRHHP
jgi:hypothetical protein